jgi:hypothetical protein
MRNLLLIMLGLLPFLMADRNIPDGLSDPLDRRVLDTTTVVGLSEQELSAKKNEAAAMVRWFEAKLRVVQGDLNRQMIESKFNNEYLARLEGITGSVPEIRVVELRKEIALDKEEASQLRGYFEMAEADIAAAKARLQFLQGHQ